jgi:lantibiotic modifying enzyme
VPQALSAALDAIPAGRAHELAELGLCHGLAGVAHVLHRAAVAHQREQAWTEAGDWGRALLARLDAGDRPSGWGFQNGSAGVILALLALTTDVAPVWDRALLLS